MGAPRRVLFICIGNSCRSQMAEGFARTYGSDVMVPASAGLSPAAVVARDTVRAMEEKNISLARHYPKPLTSVAREQFDLVINMSGCLLRESQGAPMREWEVEDPIACNYERHREIRDQIERLVMDLILEFRRDQKRARRG